MNCFAVLGLEPAPAVDLDDLQRRYHDRLKSSPEDEAGLHRAFETLRDPVKRLSHLLILAGAEPVRSGALPGAMMDLFSRLAPQLQGSAKLLEESRRASSALSRALLAAREVGAQKELQGLLAEVNRLRGEVLEALPGVPAGDLEAIRRCHSQLAFLEKWRAQVQELLLQFLSLS